ncbi:MAG: YceI family protein [Myxococcota bacterium]
MTAGWWRVAAFVGLLGAGPALAEEPAPAPAEGETPAEAPAPAPVTYRLEPAKSWLYVVVYNDTSAMASRLGHDHGVRASTFDGKVVWNTADASACLVEINFPVSALVVDPGGMRERAGLDPDGAVSDSSKETIKENMLGKKQLDGATHKEISFKATKCDGTSGKVKVTGDLTIHGVTKTVTMPMDVKVDGSSFVAGGAVTIKASDFGFNPFSNLAGALRNKDEMKLVVDVQGGPR